MKRFWPIVEPSMKGSHYCCFYYKTLKVGKLISQQCCVRSLRQKVWGRRAGAWQHPEAVFSPFLEVVLGWGCSEPL